MLNICLIFCQFQPGVADKSVAYKKKHVHVYCLRYVLLEKVYYRNRVQIIRLDVIFSLRTEKSECFSSHNMFTSFTPYRFAWSVTNFILLKRWLACHFTSQKNISEFFNSFRPSYRKLFKNPPMFSLISLESLSWKHAIICDVKSKPIISCTFLFV